MRTTKNLELHELVGLNASVVSSTNPLQVGIEGAIIDETKNMLVFGTDMGVKHIQKKGAAFRFEVNGEFKIINGNVINYRPYERTKKLIWRRRRW